MVEELDLPNSGNEQTEAGKTERFKPLKESEVSVLSLEQLKQYAYEATAAYQELVVIKTELEDIASHDDLTHIFNRRGIITELTRLINNDTTFTLLYMDLGNFKDINEAYGHLAGDIVLKTFAQEVVSKSTKRPTDTHGRLGGDEFIIILPESEIKGGAKVEDRLKRQLNRVKKEDRGEKHMEKVIPDVGITQYKAGSGESLESVLQRGDDLMKENKRKRKMQSGISLKRMGD